MDRRQIDSPAFYEGAVDAFENEIKDVKVSCENFIRYAGGRLRQFQRLLEDYKTLRSLIEKNGYSLNNIRIEKKESP